MEKGQSRPTSICFIRSLDIAAMIGSLGLFVTVNS